jgi:hypothetical protein
MMNTSIQVLCLLSGEILQPIHDLFTSSEIHLCGLEQVCNH